jgi:hypothetical protein
VDVSLVAYYFPENTVGKNTFHSDIGGSTSAVLSCVFAWNPGCGF